MSTVTNNKHANYKRKQADRTSAGAVDWGRFSATHRVCVKQVDIVILTWDSKP